MDSTTKNNKTQRHPKGHLSAVSINYVHLRNPWVTAWWSAAFPGFGQIIMGFYIKGFLLIIWEVVVNVNSKINLAIMYSFTGRFEMAGNVVNKRWLLMYVPVFIYSVWASYRGAVDLNKLSILADREKSCMPPVKIDAVEINFLDRRTPWVSAVWSLFMPGAGHLYSHKILTGFLLLGWWIAIAYYSNILGAVYYTSIGDFSMAAAVSNPEWMLFIPSMLGFAVYDAYTNTVEYNKIFEKEQCQFLKDNYQNPNFKMPF